MSPTGKNQDWWAMFKSPILSDSSPTRKNGTAFWYTDPDTTTLKEQTDSNVGAASTKNPLYNVLHRLYPFDPNSGLGYIMFNDQLPSGTVDSNRAHAKGFFVFDKNGGIYVEHSTPKFPLDPKSTNAYAFADSTRYGQSYMCVSLDFANMETLAQAIFVARPRVYSYYVPSWASSQAPSLNALATDSYSTTELQKAVDQSRKN